MSDHLLTKPVAVVTFSAHDDVTDGFAVIEHPKAIEFSGGLWIEGVHSQKSSKYARGRRVLIPMWAVTSITEYDSSSEVYVSRPRKRRK